MKSFADWTQELAESVGEVKHHWETEAARSTTASNWGLATCMCYNCGQTIYDADAVVAIGNLGTVKLCSSCYGVPLAAPPPVLSVPLCEHCAGYTKSSGIWRSAAGNTYDLCDPCGATFKFDKVRSYP